MSNAPKPPNPPRELTEGSEKNIKPLPTKPRPAPPKPQPGIGKK